MSDMNKNEHGYRMPHGPSWADLPDTLSRQDVLRLVARGFSLVRAATEVSAEDARSDTERLRVVDRIQMGLMDSFVAFVNAGNLDQAGMLLDAWEAYTTGSGRWQPGPFPGSD